MSDGSIKFQLMSKRWNFKLESYGFVIFRSIWKMNKFKKLIKIALAFHTLCTTTAWDILIWSKFGIILSAMRHNFDEHSSFSVCSPGESGDPDCVSGPRTLRADFQQRAAASQGRRAHVDPPLHHPPHPQVPGCGARSPSHLPDWVRWVMVHSHTTRPQIISTVANSPNCFGNTCDSSAFNDVL